MGKIKFFIALFAASIMAASVSAQDAVVVPPPAAQSGEVIFDDVDAKYKEASEFAATKKYGEAANAFQQVIDMGAKVGEEADELVGFSKQLIADCYIRAARPFLQTKDFDSALPLLAKSRVAAEKYGDGATALKAAQMESQIYSLLAATAFNDKDYAKAIEIYKKGYQANSKDTDLGLNLAMSYLEMTPADTTGYTVYEDIIALESVHSKYAAAAATAKEKYAYYKLLEAGRYATAKEYKKVIEITDQVIALNPTSSDAYLLTIQAATNMKDFNKVIEVGAKAAEVQVDPALKSDVYFMVAGAYENKENKAKAIENYRKVVAGKYVATAKAQIASLNG